VSTILPRDAICTL